MRRLAWLPCLLPVSCTTVTSNGLPPPLAPFAEASRFVPDGMVSFAFVSPRRVMWFPGARCEVWAGCDFEFPRKPGIGLSRSIYIGDFGERGVTAADLGMTKDTATVEIAGQACWHVAGDAGSSKHDEWRAVVDGRYALLSHHREILAAALRRHGGVNAALAAFGDLSFVPSTASELIFRLPRARDESVDGRKYPAIEPIVFAFSADRFDVCWCTTAPPDYTVEFERFCGTRDPPVRQVGAWHCQGATLQAKGPEEPEALDVALWLWFLTQFGHLIII